MLSRMIRIVPRPLRKFGNHVGRRGLFLLFFAFLWMTTGYRWTFLPPSGRYYHLLFTIAPAVAWGNFIMAVAFIMALGAFFKRADPLSFAVSAGLAAFIGTAIAITLPDKTGWTIVATEYFYTFFVLVISGWPEAPVPKKDSG